MNIARPIILVPSMTSNISLVFVLLSTCKLKLPSNLELPLAPFNANFHSEISILPMQIYADCSIADLCFKNDFVRLHEFNRLCGGVVCMSFSISFDVYLHNAHNISNTIRPNLSHIYQNIYFTGCQHSIGDCVCVRCFIALHVLCDYTLLF